MVKRREVMQALEMQEEDLWAGGGCLLPLQASHGMFIISPFMGSGVMHF
jgi:hypothetical protein